MKIYKDEKLTSFSSVALGFFDGVHLGHKALIDAAKSDSRQNNRPLIVYTFDSCAPEIFGKSQGLITSAREKTILFNSLGVSGVYFQNPDSEFLSQSAEEFFNNTIIGKLNAKCVVIGENYTFGKNKSANSSSMRALCEKNGIACVILPNVCDKKENLPISSSRIKELLLCGDICRANELLGHRFFIFSNVIHGRGDGRKIGFPTINFTMPSEKLVLPHGVYATTTEIRGKKYKSLTNIGTAPTFGENPVTAETFILGFDGDLYEACPRVEFIKKMRGEIKFDSKDELVCTLKNDTILRNGIDL